MANFELKLDRDAIEETLAVVQDSIEYDLDTEIGDKYEAIIEKALSYDGSVLTNTSRGYRNGWRDEYEALIDAWCNFCGAVVRRAAEEVLGKRPSLVKEKDMTLEQANNEYIENIKTRIHDHYFVLGDDVRVIAIKKPNTSSIYGIYLAFEDTFRLICTDDGVDLFLAIEDSVVDCKDAMWAMLVEDAKRRGFTETAVDLSNVPDEFLIDELKRRGQLS